MNKIFTANRETGSKIEEVKTIKEGIKKIEEYEKNDKKEGIFEPNFYTLVDENYNQLI